MSRYFLIALAVPMMAAAQSVQVSQVAPEPDTKSEFNFFTYPDISLYFSVEGDIRLGTVSLRYDTDEGERTVPVDYGEVQTLDWRTGRVKTRVDFALKEAVMPIKDDMLNYSLFSLVISDPTVDGVPVTGRYVEAGTGDIVLSYYYARQTSVSSVDYPDPFLSYWPADSEEGFIEVVTDGPLAPLEKQKEMTLHLYAGDFRNYLDSGEEWPELPGATVLIDGRRLIIDLRGVVRSPVDEKLDLVTVSLFGVRDVMGKEVDFYGSNLLRIYNIPLEELGRVPVMYEFSPVGVSLADRDAVELWVEGQAFRRLAVEGFEFEVAATGQVVPVALAEVDVQVDPFDPDSRLYLIPVPEAVKSAVGEIGLRAVIRQLDGLDGLALSASYFNEAPEESGIDALPAAGAPNVAAPMVVIATGSADPDPDSDPYVYTLSGLRVRRSSLPPSTPYILPSCLVLK